MSLRLLVLLPLLLLVTPLPADAKEKQTSAHKPFVCPADNPTCQELLKQPTKESSFEPLTFERAIDGDTIVASKRKIRIWGINAPEKDQPGYLAASWLMEALIKEGKLSCKLIDVDKYQREVMHCLIDGLDIGGMMVKAGMAKDYAKYSGGYYKQEQDKAKADRRGIWKASQPE